MFQSFRAAVAVVRRDGDLYFAALLDRECILDAFGSASLDWKGWLYTPAITVWVFLSQCLSPDHSCRDAVARLSKRSDVAIAVRMLQDAYDNNCDTFILVSGDSDLVPPLHAIKSRFPEKKIAVYVPARDPTRGAAFELRGAADSNKTLPLSVLKFAQFPAEVPDGQGGVILKPADW